MNGNKLLLTMIFLAVFLNFGFSQESKLKDKIPLKVYFSDTMEGNDSLNFQISNNSSDSFIVFPPGIAGSFISCLLPDGTTKEFAITYCGPSADVSVKLAPRTTKVFKVSKEEIELMLKLYQLELKSESKNTYEIYWKLVDNQYIEEKVYGRNGRFRIDRKQTHLRSNSIFIEF